MPGTAMMLWLPLMSSAASDDLTKLSCGPSGISTYSSAALALVLGSKYAQLLGFEVETRVTPEIPVMLAACDRVSSVHADTLLIAGFAVSSVLGVGVVVLVAGWLVPVGVAVVRVGPLVPTGTVELPPAAVAAATPRASRNTGIKPAAVILAEANRLRIPESVH